MTIEKLEALERAKDDPTCSFAEFGERCTKLAYAQQAAFPALLAVAKAAKEMVADLDRWEQAVAKVVDYKVVPKWNSKEATRAALAQLEATP